MRSVCSECPMMMDLPIDMAIRIVRLLDVQTLAVACGGTCSALLFLCSVRHLFLCALHYFFCGPLLCVAAFVPYHCTVTVPSLYRHCHHPCPAQLHASSMRRVSRSSLHHHCTITAPSPHHHCTITAPSLHHPRQIDREEEEEKRESVESVCSVCR